LVFTLQCHFWGGGGRENFRFFFSWLEATENVPLSRWRQTLIRGFTTGSYSK
jgi:hypothetical protein